MMKNILKHKVRGSVILTIVWHLVNNLRHHIKIKIKDHSTASGSTHATLSVKDSIRYIEGVFSDYQQISGRKNFSGRIAEIGPGDCSGVALLFRENGAEQVDLADRFYSKRNAVQQTTIYKALGEKYPKIQKILDNSALEREPKLENITRFYGEESSGENFFDRGQHYDYIISRSVLEHVDSPAIVLKKAYAALRPGGMLIHKVDLRDHQLFTPFFHDVKFLETQDFLHKIMTKGIGLPNRVLFNEYKEILLGLNPKSAFYIAGLHGVAELDKAYKIEDLPVEILKLSIDFIEKHRAKFSCKFKNVSSEDLMVSSFFFVCEKDK